MPRTQTLLGVVAVKMVTVLGMVAVVTMAARLTASVVLAQGGAEIPRTASGRPDLSGSP